MAGSKEASPKEVAQRMREIADGLSNPSDVAVAKQYAREIEARAARPRDVYWRPKS